MPGLRRLEVRGSEGPMGGKGKPWNLSDRDRAGGIPGARLDRIAPKDTRPWPVVFGTMVGGEFVPLSTSHPIYQLAHPESRPRGYVPTISVEVTAPNIKPSYLTPANPALSPEQIAAGEYCRTPSPQEVMALVTRLPRDAQKVLVQNLAVINTVRRKLNNSLNNAKWGVIGTLYEEKYYARLIAEELRSRGPDGAKSLAQSVRRKTAVVAENGRKIGISVAQTAKREVSKTPEYLQETATYFKKILTNPRHAERGGAFTAKQALIVEAAGLELVWAAACSMAPFLFPVIPRPNTPAPAASPTQAALVECTGEGDPNVQALNEALAREQALIKDNGDHFVVTASHRDGTAYLDIALKTQDGSDIPVARVTESEVDPSVTCVGLVNPNATANDTKPLLVFWRKIKSPDKESKESLVAMWQRLFSGKDTNGDSEAIKSILASSQPDASNTPTAAPSPTLAPSPIATVAEAPPVQPTLIAQEMAPRDVATKVEALQKADYPYDFTQYIYTKDSHIIIPTDGSSGFPPPSHQAEDMKGWLDAEPALTQLLADNSIAAIVSASGELRKKGWASTISYVDYRGKRYYIIKLDPDINSDNYAGPKGGSKGFRLLQIGHEVARAYAYRMTGNSGSKNYWLPYEKNWLDILLASNNLSTADKAMAQWTHDYAATLSK